jgi:hypothetical protein
MQPPDSSKTELEIVVNWRMIAVGAALAALLVVLPIVGFLCLRQPKGEPAAPRQLASANHATATPRTDSPHIRFDPASVARLEPSSAPAKVVKSPPAERAIPNPRPAAKPVADQKPEPSEPVASLAQDKGLTQSGPRRFRPSSSVYEYEMLRQLSEVPPLDLDQTLKTKLLAARADARADQGAKGAAPKPTEPKHALLEEAVKQADLKGLPLREAKDCQKKKESALVMQAVSRYFRRIDGASARRMRQDVSRSQAIMEDGELVRTLDKDLLKRIRETSKEARALAKETKWDGKISSEELAVIVQMLQVKGPTVRMQVLKMLDDCKEAPASILLAQRALFDLESDVREAAVAALKKRPRSQYRQVLLDGLRHPWPPVAAHAAEAIAELGDIGAAPQLAERLDQPDPCAPTPDAKGHWVVRELVGVNHLRNCLLCHAPSHQESDPGRSPIPNPSEPLPVVYYEGKLKGDVVRTDITYLRQDFSAMQYVENPDKWPNLQRIDYIVRTRELTAAEVTRYLNAKAASNLADYLQRSSVLYALRELTGEDAGSSSAEWRRLLRRTGFETSIGERKRDVLD